MHGLCHRSWGLFLALSFDLHGLWYGSWGLLAWPSGNMIVAESVYYVDILSFAVYIS